MNEQRRYVPASPTVLETLHESKAELLRDEPLDDFDHYLDSLTKIIERASAEVELEDKAEKPL